MTGNNNQIVTKFSVAAINPWCAVIQDPSNDDGVIQATINSRVVGFAPEYLTNAGDDVPVTFAGITTAIYGDNVTRGQLLKTDSSGRLVPIAASGTTPQNVAAIAAESGAVNEVHLVQVLLFNEYVALS